MRILLRIMLKRKQGKMVGKKIEIFTNARLSPTPYLQASKFFVLFAAGGEPSAVVSKVPVSKQG